VNSFIIKIEGYDRLQQVLKDLPKKKLQQVEDAFEGAAFEITNMQKRLAPKDVGGIAGSISMRQTAPITFEIVTQKSYAPYVEFGTKNKAVIPAELQEVAAQYRGSVPGSKLKAKEAIYAWAKRQGIPEDRFYLVFRSIMTNGIRPHPFFFQPFFYIRPKLINEIKEILTA
jgi:hypothetical protein